MNLIDHEFTGVIHLSGRSRVGVYEFAQNVSEVFDLNSELLSPIKTNIENVEYNRPLSSSLNNALSTEVINYKPKSVLESLVEMRDLMKNNMP